MELSLREMTLVFTLKTVLSRLQSNHAVAIESTTTELRRAVRHGIEVVSTLRLQNFNTDSLPAELESAALVAGAACVLTERAKVLRGVNDASAIYIDDIAVKLNSWLTSNFNTIDASNVQ